MPTARSTPANNEPGTGNPEPRTKHLEPRTSELIKTKTATPFGQWPWRTSVLTVRIYPQRASGLTRPVMLVKANLRSVTACMRVTLTESRADGQLRSADCRFLPCRGAPIARTGRGSRGSFLPRHPFETSERRVERVLMLGARRPIGRREIARARCAQFRFRRASSFSPFVSVRHVPSR